VLDGADCVMLSGETANGSFPKGAVEIMARTCQQAERLLADNDPSGYNEIFSLMKSTRSEGRVLGYAESSASSAVKTAIDIQAKAIIVLSETGETARLLAKFHPTSPILAICPEGWVARQVEGYLCNVKALCTDLKRGDGAHVRLAFDAGIKMGIFADGDAVVCVHTMRNADNVKQWTTRILNVTSTMPTKPSELTE